MNDQVDCLKDFSLVNFGFQFHSDTVSVLHDVVWL